MSDPLDESLPNPVRLDAAATPQGAALILRGLLRREQDWRRRVGDEDYERAVAHWADIAREDGGELIPMDEVRRRLGLD